MEMLLLENSGWLLLELIAEVTNSEHQTKVSQLQLHRFTIRCISWNTCISHLSNRRAAWGNDFSTEGTVIMIIN
jgi:hypothetical protein|uniref:Uncharacterized protein n=1 Tax=Populus trichocarpa TaxID=3694 RepID=A0A2K2BP94_POPTR